MPKEDLFLTDRLEAMIERHSAALLEHDVSPFLTLFLFFHYLEASHMESRRAFLSAFQCVCRCLRVHSQ